MHPLYARTDPSRGKYLEHFDPDASAGRGNVLWTYKVEKALKFKDISHALDFWRTPSKVMPTRPDGKPNRPLTAFSVEIVPVRIS